MELFREKDKPGVRRLPDDGVFRAEPGEDPLLVGGKEHPRREITPHGDNITPAVFRGWKGITVKFGKIGE
jgi:hypothetical protein